MPMPDEHCLPPLPTELHFLQCPWVQGALGCVTGLGLNEGDEGVLSVCDIGLH